VTVISELPSAVPEIPVSDLDAATVDNLMACGSLLELVIAFPSRGFV